MNLKQNRFVNSNSNTERQLRNRQEMFHELSLIRIDKAGNGMKKTRDV